MRTEGSMKARVGGPSRGFLLLAVLFLLGPALVGAFAQATPARLLSGPQALRGLPFFSPNAIPALQGEYSVGSYRIRVWSTRERLFFGGSWSVSAGDRSSPALVYVQTRATGPVLALSLSSYTLFLELPEDTKYLRRFAFAFERRFASFFENAATDAELSFPAYVEFAQ